MDKNLTDISYIKKLCDKHGFSLSKGFGQNFIVNAGICPKIVEASGITEEYGVLEIGPGIGVLTKQLALRAKKVVSLEIDDRLPEILQESLAEHNNVKIILGDVLKLDLAQIIKSEFVGMPVAVCANLPYYITSPIIMRLLEEKLDIEHITVMVQKEAADRICAKPATREAGAISLAVSYWAKPSVLFTVSPGSFYPPPKVTSAVIKLEVNKQMPVQPNSVPRMFAIIRAAFSQRRKTAVNGISSGMSLSKQLITEAMGKCNIPVMARPEQMSLQEFAQLSNLI